MRTMQKMQDVNFISHCIRFGVRALLLLSFSLVIVYQTSQHNIVSASDTVSYGTIFERGCAGFAGDLEAELNLTEAEYAQFLSEHAPWKQPGAIVMANVVNSVNVRLEPDENSEKVGLLYNDCGGYIIEYTDSWTKVRSGNVEGWVYNDYLFYGDEAQAKAEDVGCYHATINTQTLRVRQEADIEAAVLGLVAEGDVFEVAIEEGDWLVIDFEGDSGYINSEYADIEFIIDSGETMQEIAAREEAERQAQAALEAARREAARYQNYGQYATAATDVELLGALIQCEAGNQPYDGMVAVGAVVMNRVRSGAYPNSVYGVIYASGQFTPAGSGAVDRRLANGVKDSCIHAAQQAISGYSNVGSATHFRPTGRHDGIVIGGHVFW